MFHISDLTFLRNKHRWMGVFALIWEKYPAYLRTMFVVLVPAEPNDYPLTHFATCASLASVDHSAWVHLWCFIHCRLQKLLLLMMMLLIMLCGAGHSSLSQTDVAMPVAVAGNTSDSTASLSTLLYSNGKYIFTLVLDTVIHFEQ